MRCGSAQGRLQCCRPGHSYFVSEPQLTPSNSCCFAVGRRLVFRSRRALIYFFIDRRESWGSRCGFCSQRRGDIQWLCVTMVLGHRRIKSVAGLGRSGGMTSERYFRSTYIHRQPRRRSSVAAPIRPLSVLLIFPLGAGRGMRSIYLSSGTWHSRAARLENSLRKFGG